jgi:hypothetical protein
VAECKSNENSNQHGISVSAPGSRGWLGVKSTGNVAAV